MKSTFLIMRRELGAYLRSMSGYVIAAIVLLVDGLLFNALALSGEKLSSEVLSQFFFNSSGVVMVASVFISMRLFAEERQTGTLVLLASSPVHDWEIVIGKFLAALIFLMLIMAATVFMPLLIFVNGKISLGHMAAGYIGLLLLGAASLAIGTFGSSLARTQVLAAIFSGCIVVALIVCWMLAKVTEAPLNDMFTALALHGRHFPPFQAGAVHLRDVGYYLMVTYMALFSATRVMEARRWR
ncbi:MAG TPA: ABC transporter permease [Polyangia bacterium]|jgi:ABC-2 type transport system permease protein|nr:ABC transporter permease [Polyangia bacterium]